MLATLSVFLNQRNILSGCNVNKYIGWRAFGVERHIHRQHSDVVSFENASSDAILLTVHTKMLETFNPFSSKTHTFENEVVYY